MKKYRKRPVTVEAVEWTGENFAEMKEFAGESISGQQFTVEEEPRCLLCIKTLEGITCASPGDFIIKGVKGEFYPCKPDIFCATYDELVYEKNEVVTNETKDFECEARH